MTAVEMAAVALGCAAVATDLYSRTIPNWLTGAGAAAGLVCGGWAAAAGMVVGFVIFAAAHWMGGMGGGDVKLMAAFGALLGPSQVITAAVLAAIAGGLMALVAVVCLKRKVIPYAPAIVCGAWLVLLGRS
jgi:prepilin peptidase CpaA